MAEIQPTDEAEKNRLATVEAHMNKCWFIKAGNPNSCLRIKMNPVVSAASAILLWGFIIFIAAFPDHMNYGLMQGKAWVAEGWSWLYIVSQDIWIVVLLYVALHPKYGKLKLGRDDETPVYSDITWFALLFTCGVAVGMFYYVAEPMWHYKGWGSPRFIGGANGYSHKSEDAVHGMMVTWYHWGLHGWIPYTTVGALLGLLAYRRGFPLSMRFGLYPLIGDKVYGWIGDSIDILSIVTTVMGVCTSLGLGTMSINMGMARLSQGFYRGTSSRVTDAPESEFPTCAGTGHKYWGHVKECDQKWIPSAADPTKMVMAYQRVSDGIQANMTMQALIIVVITILASISVVTGLNRGITNLARLGFALSTFLMLFVMFQGDTVFQLNLTVQTFGYYIWYLPKIAFHTDAFELLGRDVMGTGGFATGGAKSWMDIWTIFYWGWWISWAPFVGTFMAKISRGRTLRQFVLCTLVVPSLYAFLWFGTVGGEAMKQQTLADSSGLCGIGWLNGGTMASKHCNLSPEELDLTTGNCKSAQQLKDDGVIDAGDEANCGRGEKGCSTETLKRGMCGKMLPTCDHYAATYSSKQKVILGLGYKPPCRLQNNGEKHPVLSGKCETFAWKRFEQKMGACVEVTTWVDVPCGGGADPTAKAVSALACGGWTQKTVDGKKVWVNGSGPSCQDACKNDITPAMVDTTKSDRQYNHFTTGAVMSTPTEAIWDNMNSAWSSDPSLDMSKVWVHQKTRVGGVATDDPGQPKVLVQPTCFVPAPDNQVCVWNQKTEDVLFDLIGILTNTQSFSNFMCVVALGSLILYFITSSDSGSLIVDIIAANGEEEPPIPQRLFWAATEGATAIALLYSGKNVLGPYNDPGEGGLRALQAASIIMGLPYTFVLFWYSQALVQVVREEAGDLDVDRPRFKMFMISLPRSDKVPLAAGFIMLLRNTFLPGFSPAVQVATKTWPLGFAGTGAEGRVWQVLLQTLWLIAFVCEFIGIPAGYAVQMMGSAIFWGFAAWVSLTRREIRKQWGIPRGDFFTDYMWSILAYMFVLTQLEIQMKEEKEQPVMKKIEEPLPASIVGVQETNAPAPVYEDSTI